MIGLDTNVLVRYFVQDDADQSARANELIDGLTEDAPGYVATIVLAEIYRVLSRAYRADDGTTLALLRGLLDSRDVTIQHSDTVRRALRRAENGADFADALIAESGVDAGCTTTVTFDRAATKSAGMRLLA